MGLSRDGPGLLVRDLLRDDALIAVTRLADARPDIAVLQGVDYDHDQVAITLLQERLAALGLDLPYRYVRRPNTGLDSGFDLDRNGKLGEPRDMQGYGRFAGQGGMAVLSRFPIDHEASVDLSGALWAEQPEAGLPQTPERPFFSAGALDVLRLHSVAAWDVAIETPTGRVRVLTFHASTPVFDGPEDRNGLRNAAELRFWSDYIDTLQADARFVLAGDFNNDLAAGEGLKPALRALLNHPRLQDPIPEKTGTAKWRSGLSLHVDYVLPSRGFRVAGAQVERAPLAEAGPRHHPVWVDLIWD
ncbi:endonuclease/exonuclease/phosphatase family metal-dependent hydrolase [Litoreibacter ponti]|uniref:Endonuclease/exonuclease/phosphatase family metal-dependent hydrolase n=1 Tax=Litoreibacter ponti TaxID=1510457 RepID=A0A2T6BPJ7_9RHOB|nr:endonuclease/exonuclease/phosphatase family protein [Litoreibacter ponti]PTX57999.1 endonuclease/exonuclease/phosphatase family metal-dependent hydrolase [Litoreibacter ponti]